MAEIRNPVKAIRAHCLDCSYSAKEVELCPVEACALHPFRLGKNPYRKPQVSKMTDEQKAAAAARLKAWRESQNETQA